MMTDTKDYLAAVVEELKTLFGEKLEAILVYGSVVSGEYNPKTSDINLLSIYNSQARDSFGNVQPSKRLKKLLHRRKINLLVFEKSEFQQAFDVFPVEFTDIKHRHKVLFGTTDPMEEFNPNFEEMRLQLEFIIRSIHIKLKQGFLTGYNIDRLMLASLPSILTVCRMMLVLRENTYIVNGREVLRKVAELFGRSLPGVERVYDYKYERQKARFSWFQIFKQFYEDISFLVQTVNDIKEVQK